MALPPEEGGMKRGVPKDSGKENARGAKARTPSGEPPSDRSPASGGGAPAKGGSMYFPPSKGAMYFTAKQLRILEFIQKYRTEKGISPTMEEIAAEFEVTKITIYEHLNELARKGALRRVKFKARSIELLVSVEDREGRMVLPLLGAIESGAPMENGNEESRLDLSSVLPLSKQCFALQVKG